MLPGFVAGHYRLEDCLIDLKRLCAAGEVRLVEGTATCIDREKRQLRLADGSSLPYDVLSLDVGITPDVDEIPGAQEYGLLVKPVSQFAPKWQALVERASAAVVHAGSSLSAAGRPEWNWSSPLASA